MNKGFINKIKSDISVTLVLIIAGISFAGIYASDLIKLLEGVDSGNTYFDKNALIRLALGIIVYLILGLIFLYRHYSGNRKADKPFKLTVFTLLSFLINIFLFGMLTFALSRFDLLSIPLRFYDSLLLNLLAFGIGTVYSLEFIQKNGKFSFSIKDLAWLGSFGIPFAVIIIGIAAIATSGYIGYFALFIPSIVIGIYSGIYIPKQIQKVIG